MRIGGKRVNHAYAPVYERIARIDNAKWRLATCHVPHRGADVFRTREPPGHAVPHAERRQCAARVAAGRDRIRICGRKTALTERRCQCKVRRNLELDPTLSRRDQDQLISDDVPPRCTLNQVAALEVVHPLGIGREEQVRRRAGLYLVSQI
jgi:hypothetical protein